MNSLLTSLSISIHPSLINSYSPIQHVQLSSNSSRSATVSSSKWSKSTPEASGMGMGGFLLISFPPTNPNFSSSAAAFKSPALSGRFTSKARSTLSICGLLVFTTFLLFTLSTFDPSATSHLHRAPRRLLLTHTNSPLSRRPQSPLTTLVVKLLINPGTIQNGTAPVKALQGMGALYRRGTRAMSDLVVAHVSDAVDERKFRSFLRTVHTGGLLARSDLVFIFSSSLISSKLAPAIREENESLLKLVLNHGGSNRASRDSAGLTRYLRIKKEEAKHSKEAIWGKGLRSANHTESTRPSYGSVVGFDATELDPENSLSGFLDRVPMGLRRWACYPMLLGRVRRSYKHVLLADVESVVVWNDPFTRVKNRSPESVQFWETESGKRGKKINPGIVVGGSKGVRRLSDAVLTEIVRAAMEHKGKAGGKHPVTESGVVNQLVRSGHLLKNVNVVAQAEESESDPGELFGPGLNTGLVDTVSV